jgi:hypothetical protein
MIRVHSQGYVGLLAVSSKVTLTNQHTDQDSDFDCGRAHFLFHRLFHRQVSRETPGTGFTCFTVKFPVEHASVKG